MVPSGPTNEYHEGIGRARYSVKERQMASSIRFYYKFIKSTNEKNIDLFSIENKGLFLIIVQVQDMFLKVPINIVA